MIENPMVLMQERYDSQMQERGTTRCDYCEEAVENHWVKSYGDLHICVDCEAQFLKDGAERHDFDGFVAVNQKDYLLNWWWNRLDDLDQLNILAEVYARRKWTEESFGTSYLASDRVEYCNDREDEFLDYLREKWRRAR